jgi:hypothetical protein
MCIVICLQYLGNLEGPKQRTIGSGWSLPRYPDQRTKEKGACPSYKHLL